MSDNDLSPDKAAEIGVLMCLNACTGGRNTWSNITPMLTRKKHWQSNGQPVENSYHSSHADANAAKERLIEKGFIELVSGSYRKPAITEAGKNYLREQVGQAEMDEFSTFTGLPPGKKKRTGTVFSRNSENGEGRGI